MVKMTTMMKTMYMKKVIEKEKISNWGKRYYFCKMKTIPGQPHPPAGQGGSSESCFKVTLVCLISFLLINKKSTIIFNRYDD